MPLSNYSPEKRDRLARLTQPRETPWSTFHDPTPKQAAFLCCDHVLECFYGGAAGGGKSDALLMAAAQYVDVPGYAALLLRRNFKQLALPGSLMHRSKAWWAGSGAEWNEGSKTWTFPSGATITFGHVQNPADVAQYESAEFQYVGFDEVTQFTEDTYRFLFSRLRRLAGSTVPLRMRSASNPRGVGFQWVKSRFVNPDTREDGAVYIPARLEDNPYLDYDEYAESLGNLGAVLRDKLLQGDWDVTDAGEMFAPWEWITEWLDAPKTKEISARVRAWDLAFAAKTEGNDPDWTAGVLMSRDARDGMFTIENVTRWRAAPGETEDKIRQVAQRDGEQVPIWIEKMAGAGSAVSARMKRHVLTGFNVRDAHPAGMTKDARAATFAAAMENGLVRCVRGPWVEDFFAELAQFPNEGLHDDMVDAAVYAFRAIADPAGTASQYDRHETDHRFGALRGRR